MDDAVRRRAVALREQKLSTRQIGEEIGVPQRTVARWVQAIPVRGWAKRPNAKDALRVEALDLRSAGSVTW